MKNLLMLTLGLSIMGIIYGVSQLAECERAKGYLKGYVAGHKEFAQKLKEDYPELFKKIESL